MREVLYFIIIVICLFKTIDIKTPYTIDCTNLRGFAKSGK